MSNQSNQSGFTPTVTANVNSTGQTSSAVIGHVINDANTAVIGHVIADASTAVIGTTPEPREVITINPTVSTSPAYTAGDAVGGKETLTSAVRISGGYVELDSIEVIDRSNQKPALTILVFDSDPAAATITDNAAFVFSTDISKLVAQVLIAQADYTTTNSIGVACIGAIKKVIKASGSANLYAAVVTTGTPTFTGTTDITIKYGFLQS